MTPRPAQQPPPAADDSSIELPGGSTCESRAFCAIPPQHSLERPINKDRREHIHSRINAAELPVRHMTRRKGRPYTLVLTKTQMLFEREIQARARDEVDLVWPATELTPAKQR